LADEYVINVVLEGNSGSLTRETNKGADSQKRLEEETQKANIAFLAQVARYQAMTAALNQTIGGLNKFAGGLEAIGFEKTAEATRKVTKGLELIAGPAEIYLAYQTLQIALAQKDVASKGAQTTATGILTAAQMKLNAVMAMNPFILIAVAIVVLVVALVALEKKFGLVTKIVDGFNNSLESMEDHFMKIVNLGKGVASVMGKIGNIASGRGMAKLVAGAK
tara:strand:+ start:500 stop:1162 length:663 start_codon:yes stop_codon:yes gene_type:complete